MRVCVTGGTGFLGRALVRRLLAEGAQARVIVVDDENLTLGQYHAAKKEIDGTRTLFFPGCPVLVGAPLGGIPRRQVTRALRDRWYDTR
ncbi:MAG: NAD-dependent epimerase/dehydratase family protein [Candidatus Acidiferrales bacterium]|jgi:nucleoside-diphosphate-sugar epimerase